jgi:geranylgeranyl diphosphate synthase type II
MVHASSLILDDLPSMDDAALPPGPSCQSRGHGEAIAILAAFGLLDAAFGAIARGYEPVLATQLTALVSDAIGGEGLIGGQAADLLATDQSISFEMLERIHRGKTGSAVQRRGHRRRADRRRAA